ncbi:MAG TPA: hypothetical protein VHF25_05870 [Nitriliruptorales bacterium]|nr:hypothetical protein [Nitriliruptorales bacterium]
MGAALGLLGVWGTLAPYAGPPLGFVVVTRPVVEVVDHVLPGIVLLGVATFALVTGRLPLPLSLLAVLAGLWMAGTHVPLLAQAARGGVEVAAALWHSLPGLLLLVVAVGAAVVAWVQETA